MVVLQIAPGGRGVPVDNINLKWIQERFAVYLHRIKIIADALWLCSRVVGARSSLVGRVVVVVVLSVRAYWVSRRAIFSFSWRLWSAVQGGGGGRGTRVLSINHIQSDNSTAADPQVEKQQKKNKKHSQRKSGRGGRYVTPSHA